MEKDNDKDLLYEEIADYYSNSDEEDKELPIADEDIPSADEDIAPADEKNKAEETIEIPQQTSNTEVSDEDDDEEDAPQKPNDKTFFIISAAVALSVLLSVFFAGILSYKSEEDINYRFSRIQTTSKKYSRAQEKINLTNDEITALEDEIAEKQSELNTITEYESNTGTIKSKQSALDSELKELNSSVKNKEKVLSDLENSASRKIPSMVTLTPGLYTVGENLFSGNYNAMGDGAIVVSSSNGGAKINTTLTSDAVSFTLEDGDIVKLETKAVFSRVQ